MVKPTNTLPKNEDGSIDIDAWLTQLQLSQPISHALREACLLSRITEDHFTFYGESCFAQGLHMGMLIAELNLNQEAIAAAIIYTSVEYGDLQLDDLAEQVGEPIAKLVKGIQQMNALADLGASKNHNQVDNLRRMLLAMVSDVRVVVIKLAERVCMMRAIKQASVDTQQRLATETMNIYAPLANRLGIHQLKWELEDIGFRYLQPDTYKTLAKQLQQRRIEREKNVASLIETLQEHLKAERIQATVYGRAKHIYSIYRKMQTKQVAFSHIYDVHAIRVLVEKVGDCYETLSTVHSLWPPITEEFDDYIHKPKPNGYQSIHTAVVGPEHNNFEIQIRTQDMHDNAEKGVAAHWLYKEGSKKITGYEEKVSWLRQLLEWQKELADDNTIPDNFEKQILEDRAYIFTPQGDIVDLPVGATPLDFAYSIHTEIGHRCRGAKINGKIVPLTHALKTGEKVEILTTSKGHPSRDWLIPQRGYLKTSRARAKVHHWFKQQASKVHVNTGKEILDREFSRLGIQQANLEKIANKLNYKTSESMLNALGNGDLRFARILHQIETEHSPEHPHRQAKKASKLISTGHADTKKGDVTIYGVGGMLTQIAQCCKPIPGDPILGYITQGHGVSIHHRDCDNIVREYDLHENRIIEVDWRSNDEKYYAVDVKIQAYDRAGIVRDITHILANEKIHTSKIASHIDKTQHINTIELTIEVSNLGELSKTLDQIQQLPNVFAISRKQKT